MTYLPALGALVLGASLAQASDMPDLLETPALEANQATSAALIDLASSREGLVAVGERGVILRLIEGAWVQSPAPVGTTLTAVAFNGEGVGLAVGHDGTVLRSADAGATWQKVTDGRALFPVVIAAAQARADAAQEALDNAGEEADLEELEFALEDELFRLETAEQSLEYGPS
ncbi:MAG: photosystem I reaction center subunit IV, partial [Pseudomonadota bacterium]